MSSLHYLQSVILTCTWSLYTKDVNELSVVLNYASSIARVDIKVHYNIILMYVYNVYLGISFPPQFPDAPSKAWMRSRLLIISCGGKCPTLACRDVSVAGNKFGEDTTGGLNTECKKADINENDIFCSLFFRKDTSLYSIKPNQTFQSSEPGVPQQIRQLRTIQWGFASSLCQATGHQGRMCTSS